MENCPSNTSVVTNNDPIDCEGTYISTLCVTHPTAITALSLPANATQSQINNALVVALINALDRITALENV